MKKFAIVFAIAVLMIAFTSCKNQSKTVTTVTTTTTLTPAEPDMSNGFYVKTQKVIKGNTLWGISKQNYGTGFRWRDIVEQNPFLNQPDRVYYDQAKKKWMVLIYPGEILKIGNEVINPTYVFEEVKTTIATTTPDQSMFELIMPLWGWLLTALVIAGIVALFVLLLRNANNPNPNATSIANSNSTVHVNIRDGIGIDLATQATLLARDQDFNDRALAILADSAKKNELSKFSIDKVDNQMIMKAKFFDRAQEPAPVKTESKEEGQ